MKTYFWCLSVLVKLPYFFKDFRLECVLLRLMELKLLLNMIYIEIIWLTEGTIHQIMTKNMSSVFLQTSDLALRSQNTYADVFGALLDCWSF